MGKMKILQIMPEFGLAGAEIMCENLCKGIQRCKDLSVIVVSLYNIKTAITHRLEREGIPIIFLNKKRGFDISIIWQLYRIIKNHKIDVVHTHRYVMQYAIPAAILARVHHRVHTIHNVADKEISWVRRLLASFFYKRMHVVPVSISPLIRMSVNREYKIPFEKIPMIYNGINLNLCGRKTNYTSKKVFEFIHIGRFSTQKNHMMIIQAVAQLRDKGYLFHINFIGVGALMDKCMAEIRALGLENYITFLGLQENVYPFLYDSDCFILPSLYEGMPISLIEAMGTGLPVIVTNVGGMSDMIQNGISGLVIDTCIEDLVVAMERIMKDEALRSKLGSNAMRKSNEFSAEFMTKKYVDIYKSLGH